MVSEPKLLASEMAAQARFSECGVRGSMNQRGNDRSFEALIETIGELKKMLEDITARLPIPTPPQPGNTSSTSGKEPIPPEPPDLLTPTQNTFNRAAALTSNGNSFLRPSLSVTAARTKTYASSNLSDLKKLIAANSEIVAPKVFEEMPHSSNINKIDALLSDNGEQTFAGYDVEINNDKLADEVLENVDALQHDEKPAQTRTIDESFVAKEAADSGVFKVFDEMPRTFDKPKMKMMDQIAKAVDDLLLLKASGEGKLSLKALKLSDLKTGKALLVVKGELTDLILVLTEFPTQGEISLDHMSVMSFDPGGQPLRKFNDFSLDELQLVKIVLGNFSEHKEEVSSDEDRGNSIVLTVDKLKDSISCFDPGGKHDFVLEATEKSGEVAQVFDGFVLKNWPEKLNMKSDSLMVYDELVFDPGGGASEPRIDFHRSRYGNFSDYLVHQLGKVVAKVDTRVICFDPGGVNQWVKLIAQGIRQTKIEELIWFWGMKFDPGGNCLASCYPREYFPANDALWIPISLCGHNVFIEMITRAETYESRTGALLIEIYALEPKLLTVMQWIAGVHFLVECLAVVKGFMLGRVGAELDDTKNSIMTFHVIVACQEPVSVAVEMMWVKLFCQGSVAQCKDVAANIKLLQNFGRFLGCLTSPDAYFCPPGKAKICLILICCNVGNYSDVAQFINEDGIQDFLLRLTEKIDSLKILKIKQFDVVIQYARLRSVVVYGQQNVVPSSAIYPLPGASSHGHLKFSFETVCQPSTKARYVWGLHIIVFAADLFDLKRRGARILVFDSGGECSSLQNARILMITSFMELLFAFLLASTSAFRTLIELFSLILEDKDHLVRGVLLQEIYAPV